MKRLGQLSVVCLSFIVFFGPALVKVSAQDVNDFKIDSFDAQYYLIRDAGKASTLEVTETIAAVFPSSDQNHGILRAIPKSYEKHTLSLKIHGVTDQQGRSWHYSDYGQNDNLVLKIGDGNRFVHGRQTYVITYQMRNVVRNLSDHDEFYWDVNGDQWAQSFGSVSAEIHLPAAVATSLQDRQVCYAGAYGRAYQDSCTIKRVPGPGETVITTLAANLSPYQTLTFVLGFNKGTFVPGPEIAHEQKIHKIKVAAAAVSIALPPLLAIVFMFRRWRQFGNDPKGRGVIIPEYEPPKNLTTLTSDYLLNQKLRNRAFSAALIELAVKRYLTIMEATKKRRFQKDIKEYSLRLDKSPDDLPPELEKVVNAVFDDPSPGSLVPMADLRQIARAKKLHDDLGDIEKTLASGLTKHGYFIKNPKAVRQSYQIWAGIIAAVGVGLFFIHPVAIAGAGVLLAALVVFGFSFIMPARTKKGVEANDALLGLRDYIKLAEADRLKFGQSPQGAEKISEGSFDPTDPHYKVKLFESLLPYAILFGLEKGWADEFKDIYKTPPDWYQGNWAAFNTYYLASSLGSFSSAASTTFSPPSSSGSSGFGGGGFSGGGGGGGGGGGW